MNENELLASILSETKTIAQNPGGGATIEHTSNLIAGDNAGNGIDSGKTAADIKTIPATANLLNGDNAGGVSDSGINPAAISAVIVKTSGLANLVVIKNSIDAPLLSLDSGGSMRFAATFYGDGDFEVFGEIYAGNRKFLIDGNGNIVLVNNVAIAFPVSQGASNTVLTNDGSGTLTWAGRSIDIDSGWTANASAGDKTVAVADYAGGGALAGLDATADAQIVALTKKFQAIESTLAAFKIPNA